MILLGVEEPFKNLRSEPRPLHVILGLKILLFYIKPWFCILYSSFLLSLLLYPEQFLCVLGQFPPKVTVLDLIKLVLLFIVITT